MTRRLPVILGLAASLAIAACNATPTGPALTDPTAIVTVTKDNVKAAIVDSGYYPANTFSGLK